MATKIERLQASLKKERERLDVKKLNNMTTHIKTAAIILGEHNFQIGRSDAINRLRGLLSDALDCVVDAQGVPTDAPPTTGGE